MSFYDSVSFEIKPRFRVLTDKSPEVPLRPTADPPHYPSKLGGLATPRRSVPTKIDPRSIPSRVLGVSLLPDTKTEVMGLHVSCGTVRPYTSQSGFLGLKTCGSARVTFSPGPTVRTLTHSLPE